MSKAEIHRLVDALPDDVVSRIEKGGPVTLVVTRERGRLTLHEIDPEQAWFWTPEWQEGEREADEDIVAGRTTRYDSDEEFLAALESDRNSLSD